MTLLSIENLSVYYQGIRAVKDVSFRVDEGQFITLIGANGAGKSSILRSIIGLVRSKEGRIAFAGEDITRLPPDEIVKRGIALCPEGRRIFATMTVEENLRMGAHLQKDRKKIHEGLERVYQYFPILKEKRNIAGGNLSGGQQQMLAIGRALMASPRLLLIDELTLGLAPIVVQDLVKILTELNRTGLSIILVEQNANMALKTASYGYVLENGVIKMHDECSRLIGDEFVQRAYLGV